MKNKYFYSHIVEISEITVQIGDMDMPSEDRVKLIKLAEENLHHAILDTVLSELSESDKKAFLIHVGSDDHSKAWKLINEKVDDAQNKIINTALAMKKELIQDIENSKK